MIRRPNQAGGERLYRSISEVSRLLSVKPHVLRYWETQFPTLRPRKNRAGNRIYRPNEVRLLARIRELLYQQRFTIEGARRQLAEERRQAADASAPGRIAPARAAAAVPQAVERRVLLAEVREELLGIARALREAGERARPPAP